MTERRRLLLTFAVILAPIVVVWLEFSLIAATLTVLGLLLLRWLIVMSGWAFPAKTPELELETIAISHFVEKVRWSMDLLGLTYKETPVGGTLGAFYRGRSVPQLKVRTGAVRSVIGNSKEILRYLSGRYSHLDPRAASFLAATPDRDAFEDRLDKHGRDLQVWAYYRVLDNKALTLQLWGANDANLPLWQRLVLKLLYPLQAALIRRAFAISDESFARSVARIESFLQEMNALLVDSRESLLDGDTLNYTDITLASYVGVWLMPPDYAAGKAAGVRLSDDSRPEAMQMDIDAWSAAYPHVIEFVQRLYRGRAGEGASKLLQRNDVEKHPIQ